MIEDINELEDALAGYYGTVEYFKWNPVLFRKFVITDGAKRLAELAECYWLMDIIASYHTVLTKKKQAFQVWELVVNEDNSAIVKCSDGDGDVIVTQSLEHTAFPVGSFKLFCQYGSPYNVIMLPSEY